LCRTAIQDGQRERALQLLLGALGDLSAPLRLSGKVFDLIQAQMSPDELARTQQRAYHRQTLRANVAIRSVFPAPVKFDRVCLRLVRADHRSTRASTARLKKPASSSRKSILRGGLSGEEFLERLVQFQASSENSSMFLNDLEEEEPERQQPNGGDQSDPDDSAKDSDSGLYSGEESESVLLQDQSLLSDSGDDDDDKTTVRHLEDEDSNRALATPPRTKYMYLEARDLVLQPGEQTIKLASGSEVAYSEGTYQVDRITFLFGNGNLYLVSKLESEYAKQQAESRPNVLTALNQTIVPLPNLFRFEVADPLGSFIPLD
jgi:hypothetical protein